jgi:trk system potassium uptake protein TrkH
MPVGDAIYAAVFHSISAFCNAGFSLFPTSLEAYRGNWLVNLTIAALIVVGGVGFVVVEDLSTAAQDWRAGRGWRLRLHSKVVLVVTGLLVLAGGIGVFTFERHNALAGLPGDEVFLACLFQSVTARTAGFSTVDYSGLTNATLFLSVLLMLIGGSPGSCAGGIKTTTVAVVVSLFRDRLLGRARVRMAHRTVPDRSVAQSVSMLVGTLAFVIFVAFALVAVELGPVPHRTAGGTFLEMLFEVVSAVGTVGLTTGVTPTLSATGKILLVSAMFVGRLGPLTLVAALARARRPAKLEYAEEDLLIG